MKKGFKEFDNRYIDKGLNGPIKVENPVEKPSVQAQAIEMIKSGRIEDLALLVAQEDLFINEIDSKSGMSALHVAFDEQRVDAVELLLNNPDVDPNIHATNGNTPLIYASQHNMCDSIHRLIKVGADVDGVGLDGNTALIIACRYGHVATINALLDYNADINIKNKLYETAFTTSLKFGHLSIGEQLLSLGVDINITFPPTNSTVLMRAIFDNNNDLIKFLLDHNIDLSIRNSSGCLAFHLACQYGRYEIASTLLSKYGSIDEVDSARRTVLMYGCMNSNEDLVEYALNNNSNFTLSDIWKTTPLMMAVNAYNSSSNKASETLRIIKLLISKHKPHQLNAVDRKSCTALWYACKKGMNDIAKLLIMQYADTKIANDDGVYPLDLITDHQTKAQLQNLSKSIPVVV